MVGSGHAAGNRGHSDVIPGRSSSQESGFAPKSGTREDVARRGAMPHGDLREILALLALRSRPGLGDRTIWRLVRRHGSGLAALRSIGDQGDLWSQTRSSSPSSGKPSGGPGGGPGGIRPAGFSGKRAPAGREVTRELVEAWVDEGLGILHLGSPAYPTSLLELSDPPPLLFFQGRESLLHRQGVAVVGARKATEMGRRLARRLGRTLAGAGIPVVSGMAMGIDGAAHRGALEAGGPTVAVLGSGLKVVYPRSHRALSREIGEQGLLVSEFLPEEPSLPHHFPQRNRIIAAMSGAVVVVEAGARSGALITVDHGLDLGRDILAFPGSVESAQSVGTNRLIRDGARLLTGPEAILDEVAGLLALRGPPRRAEGDTSETGTDLPSGLRTIWNALSTEPQPLETVAREARVSPGKAMAGLTDLELLGRARRCPGMRFCRA